jgi:hypothetical protein
MINCQKKLVGFQWLLLLGGLFSLVACQRDKHQTITYRLPSAQIADTEVKLPASFVIQNNSDTATFQCWWQNQHAPNYRSPDDMLRSVLNDSMTGEQKAISLWQLVSQSGFHYDYVYDHALLDHVDPFSLLTFPYFMCGEKAGILFNLCRYAGLETRIVRLKGHIANEVFYDNGWHYFDSDERMAFVDDNAVVLSAQALKDNPTWIQRSYSLSAVNRQSSLYYSKYKKYFNTLYVETDLTSFAVNPHLKKMDFTLHPKDMVTFDCVQMNWFTCILNNALCYEGKGKLIRKLNPDQSNIAKINDSTWLYTDTLPYFITSVEVSTLMNNVAEVYLLVRNRITNRLEQYALGNFSEHKELIKTFNAPARPDIYYDYKLLIKNCSAKTLSQMEVAIHFPFNVTTLGLHQVGSKKMHTTSYSAFR